MLGIGRIGGVEGALVGAAAVIAASGVYLMTRRAPVVESSAGEAVAAVVVE
jgi:AAHS family 4-hydroxybenzoate transporter-like MFS transporter